MGIEEKVASSFEKLQRYCEKEEFRGWDPYDGLNSKVFRTIPGLKSNRFMRLAWIQLFKRNPVNLRRILLVPKELNPKGLGLFLHSYCNLYLTDPRPEYLEMIRFLSEKVEHSISPGYSGACWGYNFDWQAKAFFQPRNTPTVVASTFVGFALYEAYEILKDNKLLEIANSVSRFVLKDLNRTYDRDGDFSFSYSPMDQSQVFNASLLGSRLLARTYSYTGEPTLLEEARKSVSFCIKHQKEDGSWAYSTLPHHQWIDNFHTGYNLECISEYEKYSGDRSFQTAVEKGFSYYMDTFFLPDGRCKYYSDSLYPIDIHAAAQLVITLNRMGQHEKYRTTVDQVLHWTIDHMQAKRGYFYFQKRKGISSKIPYIRWAQAWMYYALTDFMKYRGAPGGSASES